MTDPIFNWNDLAKYKQTGSFLAGYPVNMRSFYSPHDPGIHSLITSLLASSGHSIVLNMYGFDDDDANEILKAKMLEPRIYVQMSLDSSQAGGKHEKELLSQWPSNAMGTSVAVGRSARHAISHLKMCIVDGIYVVSGSTNWSLSGENDQDNQITLFNDPVVAAEARAVLDVNHTEMLKQMASKIK